MKTIRVEVIRPGKGVWQFEERMAVNRSDLKILILDHHEHHAVDDDGSTILEPRSPIVWFVLPNQWYEIGAFHTPAGVFTGWYTNLCTPFEMDTDRWRTTDLFLDFWQPVSGPHRFLDEKELEDAVRRELLDRFTIAKIHDVRDYIGRFAALGAWPPPAVMAIDLARVRGMS